jgi:4-hydroxy-2-oxoheptanedioate aldolase
MRNRLRELLETEPSALGAFVTLRDPAVTELAALAGFDLVLIETEHAAIGLETMEDHLRAARAHGIGTLVRVPSDEAKGILRVLDSGADGVLVPHVGTAEAARRAVEAVRYPPLGHRGMYAGSRAADFGAHGLGGAAELTERLNRDTVVTVMVEDASGVAEVEDIAAVPGLDVIHIGPSDLSASLGRVGASEQPEITAALDRVRAACAANGIRWGFPVGNGAYPLTALELRERGAFLLTAGSEAAHLLQAFRATVSAASPGAVRPV